MDLLLNPRFKKLQLFTQIKRMQGKENLIWHYQKKKNKNL